MKKLGQEGLKKFNHNSAVTEDEIYFFRRPINPAKVRMKFKHLDNILCKTLITICYLICLLFDMQLTEYHCFACDVCVIDSGRCGSDAKSSQVCYS